MGATAVYQHRDSVGVDQIVLIKDISRLNNINPNPDRVLHPGINNISLNQDHVLKENSKPLRIPSINNIINSDGPDDIKELRNKRLTRNSGVANSNKKEGSDSVRAKAITIIINKLPVNRDILNYLNIIEKTDSKDLGVLDNTLEITKKRQSPLKEHPDEPRRKVTRIFLSVEEDIRYVKDTPIHAIKNPVPIPTCRRTGIESLVARVGRGE